MSAPGTIRTRDLGGRNALLCPLSYGGNEQSVDAQRLVVSMLPDRMVTKIYDTGTCWIWTGAHTSNGYSSIGVNGSARSGHRHAYELLIGPVPDGLQLDHLCRNRSCVRPDHLEPVTSVENNRRKPYPTACPKGHGLIGDNVRIRVRKNGWVTRECRACQIERVRRRDAIKYPHRKPTDDRIDTSKFLLTSPVEEQVA